VFWSAATAHKLALWARLDDTPLPSELLEVSLHPAVAEVLQRQVPLPAQRALRARAEEIVARHLSSALAGDRTVDTSLLEHAEALARSRLDEASPPWRVALQERRAELYRRRGDHPMSLQLLEGTRLIAAPHRATHDDLRAGAAGRPPRRRAAPDRPRLPPARRRGGYE